jgi:ubiquinone/menaquinone biosynthesis methyltransferase
MERPQPGAVPARSPAPPDRSFVSGLFNWLAPRYDEALQAYSLGQDMRWKEVLVGRLRVSPGERALDLACGTGGLLDRLSRAAGSDRVVGLDASRPMLRRGQSAAGRGRRIQADAEALPFTDRQFDVVTAGYLLKYVRLGPLLAEVFRVLRPGGRFGGYDFSAPRITTPSGRAYSLYLHRLLPWLGRIRSRSDPGWRTLFDFLSAVSETSGWESRIAAVLTATGFDQVRAVPSLGGAITWVWARRPLIAAPMGLAPSRPSPASAHSPPAQD